MGEYPIRLLNLAVAQGVPVFGAMQTDNGDIVCFIPMRCMRSMRRLAKSSGCRLHIVSGHGLPMLLERLKRRPAICVSVLAFAFILAFASSRIWAVRIESGDIPQVMIEAVLRDNGVLRGARSADIDIPAITAQIGALLEAYTAEVIKRGVVLDITVTERQGLADALPSDDLNSGIYADKDCVITYVSAVSGRAVVVPGDAVKAGQLLITGDKAHLKEGYSVPAEGEITGRVLYRASASCSVVSDEYRRTGRYADAISVNIFGKECFLLKPYESCELEAKLIGTSTGCAVPVSFCGYVCYETALLPTDIGKEAAGEKAAKEAQRKLFASVPKDARIVSVHTVTTINDDGSVTASATAVTIENIGYKRGM